MSLVTKPKREPEIEPERLVNVGGLVAKEHDENQLLRISVPSGNRRWVNHFGPIIAAKLRKRRPRPHSIGHLDEVYLKIDGRMVYLWRAVDSEGEVAMNAVFVRDRRCRLRPAPELDPVDQLKRIVCAKSQLFRIQFLCAAPTGPSVLNEVGIRATDVSVAIVSAARLTLPPKRSPCASSITRIKSYSSGARQTTNQIQSKRAGR